MMAKVQSYPTAIMQRVNDILPLYGNSNFADILNRLWMNGAPVDKLKNALLDDPGAGNTPEDVMAALLSQGIVTEQQLREAASSYVPPNAPNQPWPFHPEHTDQQGRVIPVFNDDSTKFYPDAPHPISQPAPSTTLAPGGGKGAITTVTGGTPPPKKDMSKASPAELEQYERDHYGNMMWVKSDPELGSLLDKAAKLEWTPEKFRAEFENSNWWKNNSASVRSFIERQNTDATTLNKEIDDKTKGLLATSTSMGFNLTYQDLVPLATDAIKFGWDDLTIKQNLISKIKYSPDQAGGLGAMETRVKGIGKDYLINMSDEDAFNWATKLFTGEASEDTVTEALRTQAKGSYPTIADYIEKGGTPKAYFGQHINTIAQLMEMDPTSIDLTDPKWNQVISHADDKGNIRPMTVSETASFTKQKDEYWKTNNSGQEVSSLLNTLGTTFGKVAI